MGKLARTFVVFLLIWHSTQNKTINLLGKRLNFNFYFVIELILVLTKVNLMPLRLKKLIFPLFIQHQRVP